MVEKRYNNFTTAEIKNFANDPALTGSYFDSCINSEDKLKKIFKSKGWQFEETEYGVDDFNDLSTFDVEADLCNAISILAWKILYERDLHNRVINNIRNELKDVKNEIKQMIKDGSLYNSNNLLYINDPDLEIKEGDEDDYYDEYEFKKLKKE